MTPNGDLPEHHLTKESMGEQTSPGILYQHYQKIFHNAPDSVFYVDNKGIIIECSKSTESLYKRPKEKIIGKHVTDFMTPESILTFKENFPKLASLQNVDGTIKIINGDGETLNIWRKAIPLTDEKGKFIGAIAFDRDVTLITIAQKNLSESEKRFKSLFEQAGDAIFIYEMDGTFIDVNEEASRQLGYTREEFLRMNINQIDTQITHDKHLIFIKKLEEKGHLMFDAIHIAKDGKTIDVEAHASIINIEEKPLIMMSGRDISERKLMETALRESEAKLLLTIDEAPIGITSVSLDKRFLKCNKAFCNFLGYSEEELKQKTITDVTFKDDIEIGMSDLRAIVAGEKKTAKVVKRYVRKDGHIVWGEVNVNLVKSREGHPLYFLPVIQDITERKLAEQQLNAEKANLDAVFESSPVAMFVVDKTTNIVMANEAFAVMCGVSEADILQHRPGNALRCVHSHKDPRGCGYSAECKFCNVRNGVEGLITNGGSLHGAELELELTRNEEPKKYWMRIGAEPMQLSGRQHMCISMEDITMSKRTEDALQESEARFKGLFENAPDAIILADIETGAIIDTNRAAVKLTGKSRDELMHLNQSEIHPEKIKPIDSFKHHIEQAETMGIAPPFESIILHQNGSEIHVEITARIIYIKGRPVLQGIFRDISERKELEKAKKLKSSELEKFSSLSVDRELRLVKLKNEVNSLLESMGEKKKYKTIEVTGNDGNE